jgi:hypothetical protein
MVLFPSWDGVPVKFEFYKMADAPVYREGSNEHNLAPRSNRRSILYLLVRRSQRDVVYLG